MKLIYNFTYLNEFIALTNKASYGKGNRNYNPANVVKRETTNFVHMSLLGKPKIKTPCRLKFTWLLKDKRHDLDNVAYAKKFVIDGMVKAGLLPNDGLRYVIGFQDEYEISAENGVIIEVLE